MLVEHDSFDFTQVLSLTKGNLPQIFVATSTSSGAPAAESNPAQVANIYMYAKTEWHNSAI